MQYPLSACNDRDINNVHNDADCWFSVGFLGLAFAILVLAVFATIILWIYGSFWTTLLVIFIGGASFAIHHERVTLFIAALYSVYSAKSYVGWLGLLLGA